MKNTSIQESDSILVCYNCNKHVAANNACKKQSGKTCQFNRSHENCRNETAGKRESEKPVCKQKKDKSAAIPIFIVIGTNGEYAPFPDWVVAAYFNEQDAKDHMDAAQAVADKHLEDFENGLLDEDCVKSLENEFDPGFYFDKVEVSYSVEQLDLFKSGQSTKDMKKWAKGKI